MKSCLQNLRPGDVLHFERKTFFGPLRPLVIWQIQEDRKRTETRLATSASGDSLFLSTQEGQMVARIPFQRDHFRVQRVEKETAV